MGNGSGLPDRLPPEEERKFPNLLASGYKVTSDRDPRYNCIAYAADDVTQKWDCSSLPLPGYYWPPGAHRGDGPESLRSCFEAIGYERCTTANPEPGFEKVALYIDSDGFWSHAAKLDDDGNQWASRLGLSFDIRHNSPHCFGGSEYGNVVFYMKRPLGGSNAQVQASGSTTGPANGSTSSRAPKSPD